jgi:hypothetical protein
VRLCYKWFRIINQTTLEIEHPAKQYIIDFTNSEIDKLVPKERARAFPSQLHAYVLDELSKNNIKYILVYFENSEWIVWGRVIHKPLKALLLLMLLRL